MINMSEIEEEIKKLEKCDCTTYDVCKKLAILYTVKDHYRGNEVNEMRSPTPSMPMMNGK